MGRPGRKSAASLSVLPASAIKKPDPPGDLTDSQATEWRAIVRRMPAEWFPRETHGMLAQYCREIVTAGRISALVTAMESSDSDDFNLKDYSILTKMHRDQSAIIAALATKMRLTQQSSYAKTKTRGKITPKPWKDQEEKDEG